MRIQEQTKPSLSIKAIGALSVFIAIGFIGIQSLQATTPLNSSVEYTANIIQSDSIYMEVDQMPEFPGGKEAMMQFIIKNTIYPSEAKKKKISGRVYISFIVDTDGKVGEVSLLKGSHPLLDQAAIDAVKKLPNFSKPGMQDEKLVKVQLNIPINFSL